MARLPGFGERLRDGLTAGGLTQADLARATGKTSGSVVRWIRGEIPALETLQRVSKAVVRPMAWLLLGELVFLELPDLIRLSREPRRFHGHTPSPRTSVGQSSRAALPPTGRRRRMAVS